MEVFIIIAILFLIFVAPPLVRALRRSGGIPGVPGVPGMPGGGLLGLNGSDINSLLQAGTPARGILLKVGTQRSAQGSQSAGYYEVILVDIDVEVDGKRPYECTCQLMVPANLRPLVLPGATVELRIDPSSKKNIAVYGPGVGLPTAG